MVTSFVLIKTGLTKVAISLPLVSLSSKENGVVPKSIGNHIGTFIHEAHLSMKRRGKNTHHWGSVGAAITYADAKVTTK